MLPGRPPPRVRRSAVRRMEGLTGRIVAVLPIGLSLYALYWVLFIVTDRRSTGSASSSFLSSFRFFLSRGPGAARPRQRLDGVLIARQSCTGVAAGRLRAVVYRAADPRTIDLMLGASRPARARATRTAVGWILPVTAAAFLVYALVGPHLDAVGLSPRRPPRLSTYRLIGTLYMTSRGSSAYRWTLPHQYSSLFTSTARCLGRSGAGQFFIAGRWRRWKSR